MIRCSTTQVSVAILFEAHVYLSTTSRPLQHVCCSTSISLSQSISGSSEKNNSYRWMEPTNSLKHMQICLLHFILQQDVTYGYEWEWIYLDNFLRLRLLSPLDPFRGNDLKRITSASYDMYGLFLVWQNAMWLLNLGQCSLWIFQF